MYIICKKRKIKLAITNHLGTRSNNFFRKSKTARQEIFAKGLKIKTLKAYPIITMVETIAWSWKKLLKCNTTVNTKNRLQTNATLDKNETQRIS